MTGWQNILQLDAMGVFKRLVNQVTQFAVRVGGQQHRVVRLAKVEKPGPHPERVPLDPPLHGGLGQLVENVRWQFDKTVCAVELKHAFGFRRGHTGGFDPSGRTHWTPTFHQLCVAPESAIVAARRGIRHEVASKGDDVGAIQPSQTVRGADPQLASRITRQRRYRVTRQAMGGG